MIASKQAPMVRRFAAGALAVWLAAAVGPAQADPVADFYRGKTITCYIGYGVGGGYDLIARTISRHMARHIPGEPSIVPVNMPGASSMVLANYLAKRAPADGTAFGAVNSALVYEPLFSGAASKAQFRAPDLTMIGNAVSSASIFFAWHTTGIKTVDDLKTKPLIIGAPSNSGDTYLQPLAIKNVLRLDKLKIVTGYPGTREIALAIEQGEARGPGLGHGRRAGGAAELAAGSTDQYPAQLAPNKMPEVPADVPLIKDYVVNEDDKKVLDVIFMSTVLARPYIAPPGVPAERAGRARGLHGDDAGPGVSRRDQRLALTIAPTSGAQMQQIVRDNYGLPESIVLKVRKALGD